MATLETEAQDRKVISLSLDKLFTVEANVGDLLQFDPATKELILESSPRRIVSIHFVDNTLIARDVYEKEDGFVTSGPDFYRPTDSLFKEYSAKLKEARL